MELLFDDVAGRGLFADVWRATDNLGRQLAVKFIRDAESHEERLAMDHARALARVRHPQVVRLLALEKQPHPETSEPRLALVMDFVQGTQLARIDTIKREEALPIALDLVDALSAIHDTGTLHGDLHDGNVMVAAGRATVIDMLYTHSLAEVGTKTAVRNKDEDYRDAVRILRSVLDKAGVNVTEVEAFVAEALNEPRALPRLRELLTKRFAPEGTNRGATGPSLGESPSPVVATTGTTPHAAATVEVVPTKPKAPEPTLHPEDSTPFFHDRMSDAFPGVSGLYVVSDPKEILTRLRAIFKKPILFGNYAPIWEIGRGTMEIRSFKTLSDGGVLLGHHRYSITEVAAFRAREYWRDFILMRWAAEKPTGLYTPPEPEELVEWVERYGNYTEEYGVWRDQLVTREEYDDGQVFRDGKLRKISARLEVRQLADGVQFIVAQRSPLNDKRNDRARWSQLSALQKGTATYTDIVNWVETLDKHRLEE